LTGQFANVVPDKIEYYFNRLDEMKGAIKIMGRKMCQKPGMIFRTYLCFFVRDIIHGLEGRSYLLIVGRYET
jgi:hypothetical protein